ncbi:MAG: glycosyltransferase family 4 protein [Azospirillaceae bacterium]
MSGPETIRAAPRPGSAGPTILQIIPALDAGGAERGCIDVAAAIVDAGGRALVASTGGRMVAELERTGGEWIDLPVASKNPLVIRANARRLADLIRARGVDLVHVRSRAPAWSALAAARRTGVGLVSTVHNDYGAGTRLKRLYNSAMVRADRVIAISPYVERYLTATYDVPAERIRVVPRGIDPDRFAPESVGAERVAALATAWRVPDEARVIVLPARVTDRKGHLVLIDALARLGRTDVVALFVGETAGRERYVARITERTEAAGVSDRIRLTGHCEDLPAAMKLADIVCLPTRRPEGFGRVYVEAARMGRPVVASAVGAALDLVADGETGRLVPPDDAAALAEALVAMLDLDDGARARLAATAQARAAPFTRARMTAETLAVYEELLGRPFPSRAAEPAEAGAAGARP